MELSALWSRWRHIGVMASQINGSHFFFNSEAINKENTKVPTGGGGGGGL